jgi:hypothetical protein
MVHTDYAVEFLASLRKERSIRWKGTGDVEAACTCYIQCGAYNYFFLAVAEETVLAGVWVESATKESGFLSANTFHGLLAKFNDFEDSLFRKQCGNFCVTNVRGHEDATNLFGVL